MIFNTNTSRLPVAMSKIPTVTERLQMTERNILNRLLAARNPENGENKTATIIPGEKLTFRNCYISKKF